MTADGIHLDLRGGGFGRMRRSSAAPTAAVTASESASKYNNKDNDDDENDDDRDVVDDGCYYLEEGEGDDD
jgi:hypothetical protein